MRSISIPVALILLALPVWADQSTTGEAGNSNKEINIQPWTKLDDALLAQLKRVGNIDQGRFAYVMCRGCHNADGSGRPDAGYPQLAGQHTTVLIKQLMDQRAGRRDNARMHPFIEEEAVPESDIADIAAYLNSLPIPPNNRKGDGNHLKLGKTLYEKDCADCHGLGGEGNNARLIPVMAGQHYPYLYREALAIRDKIRTFVDPETVRRLAPYTDQDIEAVCDYMSRLPPPPGKSVASKR